MSKHGFSLVSALIGIGLLSLGLMALAYLITSGRVFEARQDRRVWVEQVLAETAYTVLKIPYQMINDGDEYCKNKFTIDPTRVSKCLSASGMISPPSPPPGVPNSPFRKIVEVGREWNGDVAAAGSRGRICVEVDHCEKKAKDYLYEITLVAYWDNPNANQSVQKIFYTFRKSKW